MRLRIDCQDCGWICSRALREPWKFFIEDFPPIESGIILRSAFGGRVLADAMCVSNVYYVDDLKHVLRSSRGGPLSARESVLVDFIDETGKVVKDHEELKFSGGFQQYQVVWRSCPRCTLCCKACTRTGAHQLCSHGGTKHLWHFCKSGKYIVQGYHEHCGLRELIHGLLRDLAD